jgi:myo-inositol-1(or 4)-monophosphatase
MTDITPISPEQEFVASLLEDTGVMLMDRFRHVLPSKKKAGAGLVTEADTLAEKMLITNLGKQFPGSKFLAEESGGEHGPCERKWIIDPLDGTSNFAHGLPWFAVSVALEVRGELEMGWVYVPATHEMFFAQKGKGALLNGRPIRVSETREIEDSVIATGFYYFKGDELDEQVERFRKVQRKALGVRRAGSAALDLAYTAAGFFDGYWEVGIQPWDVAAGALLVKEAGGMVTDLNAGQCFVYGRNIIATNQKIYHKLLWLL